MNKKTKLSGRKLGIIGTAAAVVLALIIGISIYNFPQNRLSRQLDLGQKYLLEQNYEQAIVEFDKAIAIDPMSVEAYIGKAEAYMGMDDYDSAIETLKKGYEATGENADILDKLVEAYLGKAEGYESAGDYDSAIRTLEEGYQATSENTAIKTQLVGDYLIVAEKKTKSGAYAESLKDHDRMLELDKGNDKVIGSLCDCLNKYLEVLLKEGRYDEIRTLAAKYKNVASGVNFDKYLKQIEELERIKAENDAFMQKVCDLMAAEDYAAIHEMDDSAEAASMMERMTEDHYIYLPDGNADRTGTGAGIYKFGEDSHYFYYGNYGNGSREGDGTFYMDNYYDEEGYFLFTGQWGKDAPNGPGEVTAYYDNGFSGMITVKGNLKNGLWDGKVEKNLTTGGTLYDLSFSAVNGIPAEDKTAEFVSLREYPQGVEKGNIIYAYDDKPGIGRWACSWAKPGDTIGVAGFADVY